MHYNIPCVERKTKTKEEKQVADFIIKTERICEKEDILNYSRSLTFDKNNIYLISYFTQEQMLMVLTRKTESYHNQS